MQVLVQAEPGEVGYSHAGQQQQVDRNGDLQAKRRRAILRPGPSSQRRLLHRQHDQALEGRRIFQRPQSLPVLVGQARARTVVAEAAGDCGQGLELAVGQPHAVPGDVEQLTGEIIVRALDRAFSPIEMEAQNRLEVLQHHQVGKRGQPVRRNAAAQQRGGGDPQLIANGPDRAFPERFGRTVGGEQIDGVQAVEIGLGVGPERRREILPADAISLSARELTQSSLRPTINLVARPVP